MKTKLTALYYIMLLTILLSWTSQSASPSIFYRMMFVIAVILPGISNRHGLLLAALTCFWTISTFGYAYSFMPTMTVVYVFTAVSTIILFKYKTYYTSFGGGNLVVPLLIILTCVRNLGEGGLADNLVYALILVLLSHFLLPSINSQTINHFQVSFMAITIVLSLTFISISDLYTQPDEMGRIGWTDQNYMGMVIGMGATIGVANCLRFHEQSTLMRTMSIASTCVAVTVLLQLASRGALLCLVVSVVLLLIMSTSNKYLKFMIVIIGAVFLYYLYTNEYFDLLEKRIEEDDSIGSGRLEIWGSKWDSFIKQDSLLELLFGVGREQGLAFGATAGKHGVGFHNDFLAFFVSYGIAGLSLFVSFLTQPLRNIRRHSPYRVVIIANVAYLVTGCLTLEPFYLGIFPFYAFLMYTMLLTRVKKI